MHVAAHLDVDVVAVDTDDRVTVLVELTAPSGEPADGAPTDGRPTDGESRPARTLQVVLDRSGSMSEGRLEGAITALLGLIDRLDPGDNFGLVAFDNQVELTVPAGKLDDKPRVKRAIAALTARGGTDLSSGFLRGLREAERVAGPAGATVLLISDGHANAGITAPDRLGAIASGAQRGGIATTTLGYGLGYDERLMSAIARGGAGNELFAEEPDTAVTLIAREVDGLLAETAQAASVLIRPSKHVRGLQVVNDLSVAETTDGVVAELGNFYAGENRRLVLVFDVPAVTALGLTQVATLELTYVELPRLTKHIIGIPVHVNVVPGDQAAGRIPDPVVRTELIYQQVQRTKRHLSGLLSAGDAEKALADLRHAQSLIQGTLAGNPPPGHVADLVEEARALRYLVEQTELGMISRAAKHSSMDARYKSTKRGRPHPLR